MRGMNITYLESACELWTKDKNKIDKQNTHAQQKKKKELHMLTWPLHFGAIYHSLTW